MIVWLYSMSAAPIRGAADFSMPAAGQDGIRKPELDVSSDSRYDR